MNPPAALPVGDGAGPASGPVAGPGLHAHLLATAGRHGARVAFKDQPDRQAWSGRPPIDWTYAIAAEIVRRLAGALRQFGLPPGAAVGLWLPGGSEACLGVLAVEEAGLTPCLLPMAWSEAELSAAVEAANVQALVTLGMLGNSCPAEAGRRVAAGYFGLRFVAAFGPGVPDGVLDLDRVVLAPARASGAPCPACRGVVTFSRSAPDGPVFRPMEALLAAGQACLAEARIQPGERILTLLAGDDLCGLATGLVTALLVGGTLECHGLFSAGALVEALATREPTHLVAPAWMEDALAAARIAHAVRSVVVAHRAPAGFRARPALGAGALDVIAFDEWALVAARRSGDGRFALALDSYCATRPNGASLLQSRTDPGGAVSFTGPAADLRSWLRGAPGPPRGDEHPVACGFKAEVFAGLVIAVSRA